MSLEGLEGSGFDADPFTSDGEGGDEPIETGSAADTETTAAGGKGAATDESPLSKRMKELGLDDDAATRLLGERHEEAEEDRQREAEERIASETQARVNREFPGMFQRGLAQYMQDPRFRQQLEGMLARYEPGGRRAAEDDTIDPATRTLHEIRNEMRALTERNAALEQRLKEGAEAEVTMRGYRESVGGVIEGWAQKNAAAAEEFGADIISDLRERERNAGGRSFKTERELRRYLSDRASHYQRIAQRIESRRGGGSTRPGNTSKTTTRPLGGNTGTTRGQAPRSREQTDLRIPAITAGVLEDMARYRGDAGGD